MTSKLENIANSVKNTIAAAGLFATVACGGTPTSPSPSEGGGNGGSGSQTAKVTVTAVETFSGSPVSVDYVVDCNGQKTVGKTNAEAITTPIGNCEIRVGMDANNQRTTDTLVPSVYKSQTITGDYVLNTDLASYNALFGGAGAGHDPKHIIETYYGQGSNSTPGGTNATLGKWTSRPTKFIIWNDPNNSPQNQIEFGNANYSRYLEMMRYVEEFTGGLITVPSQNEVTIKNELPIGIAAPDYNPSRATFENDSYNFINVSGIAREWSVHTNNGIRYSSPLAPIQQANFSAAVAEAVNSTIQGNGQSSEPGATKYSCILDNLGRRNNLDDAWIKGLIYGDGGRGKRKAGERFLPSGDSVPSEYGFPYEIRLR